MDTVDITKISVDSEGRIRVVPAHNPSKMFRFVYRAAMGPEWDEEMQDFYSPIPKEWSHSDWFSQILAAVKSEMGVSLKIVPSTVWENVPTDQRQEIEKENGN